MKQSFPKEEKLKSQKLIERLFQEGSSAKSFPLKAFWVEEPTLSKSKIAFSVPKRNFKKAVDRNRIKRLMREGYRLQKNAFLSNDGKKFAILFVYLGREIPSQSDVTRAIASVLKNYF